MGEHKLKQPSTVRRGPHGKHYYCRNGCGRVIHTLHGKQQFIERAGVPHYGWCMPCIAADHAPADKLEK